MQFLERALLSLKKDIAEKQKEVHSLEVELKRVWLELEHENPKLAAKLWKKT